MRVLQNSRGVLDCPWLIAPKLMFLAVVLTFTVRGGHMTPETVFVTLAMFQAIRNATSLFIPFAIAFMMEARVSVTRVKVSKYVFMIHVLLNQRVLKGISLAPCRQCRLCSDSRALSPLFGNGAGAFRIGKNCVVLIKIGKKYKVLCIEVFIVRLI